MKEIKIYCNGCKKELTDRKINSWGVYTLSHTSCLGEPIIGDNRVFNDLHYCHECFNSFYDTLPK